MTASTGGRDRAIRSSADGLHTLATSAPGEIDDVDATLRAAMAEIITISTSALPRGTANSLETALNDVTSDMLGTLDDLKHEVVDAIETHSDELEELLRPDADTSGTRPDQDEQPPPLPPLGDITHPKGSHEWAAEVVRRYPRLTVDEVLAIHYYTTVQGVEKMNGHLRDPDSTPEADREAIEKRIAAAASGLAKLPKYDGIAFRGTNLPDHVLPNWRRGARVSDPAFVSSSVDDAVAENFRRGGNAFITITGRSGVDVQQLSYFGAEAEILFRPGTSFRVVNAVWDDGRRCWDFDVDEVAE